MQQLVIRSGVVPLQVIDHGGGGADVVLLHGGGRTSRDWDQVAHRLATMGYRTVAVDLRGHGGTPVAPWIWELVVDDVATVVDTLGLHQPVVVGHSLGGMVAALWAASHSSCPLAVNLDGHGNPTRADQYAGLDQHDRARAHQVLQSCFAPMAATLTEHLREVLRSVDGLDLFEVYRRARCRLVIASGQQSLVELLPAQAQAPWRAYERWVQAQLDQAAAANPAVALVWLPTGHDPHLEAPEAVASLVHHWLT
jgi:pimeloyl-ACP methyl ester carboxylesterase